MHAIFLNPDSSRCPILSKETEAQRLSEFHKATQLAHGRGLKSWWTVALRSLFSGKT